MDRLPQQDMCWQLIDLAFCVHVTDSNNVATMKEYVSRIIQRMAVDKWNAQRGTKMMRISLTTYWQSGYDTAFYFNGNSNRYNSNDALDKLVADTDFSKGVGKTGDIRECLKAQDQVQTADNGMRDYAEGALFIITDGEMRLDASQIATYAIPLGKKANLTITAMMVGNTLGSASGCSVLSEVLTYSDTNTTQTDCNRDINRFTWDRLLQDASLEWAFYSICPSEKNGMYIIMCIHIGR